MGWLGTPRSHRSNGSCPRIVKEHADEVGAINAGYYAIDCMRTEKGYRGFGHEISPDEDPLMAGLSFAVKFDKPDFMGKEALLKKKAEGVPKKRLIQFGLKSNPEIGLWGGEPLLLDGQYCGYLTSGTYGFSLGHAVGMGYVRDKRNGAKITKKFLEENKDKFQVEVFNERYPVEPRLAPYFDPK